MKKNIPSPERLYLTEPFNLHNENVVKHIARYKFASNFASGEILDCACGSGYGSKILSKHGHVTGVDRSDDAIAFARENNASSKIRYYCRDISRLMKIMYDSVVCLETFEHLPYELALNTMERFTWYLKPTGTVIVSTPMLRFQDGKPYVTNPHHINELPKRNLIYTFDNIFSEFTRYYFHQDGGVFHPLRHEDTGFMIMVAKRG